MDGEHEESSLPEDPAILDGGRVAWTTVFGSFMISTVCYGLSTSFGAFEEYYRSNQLKYHSLQDISWIGSLQLSLILLTGSISGPLFDAGYYRYLISIGGALYVFCLFMTSISTEYYQFILSHGFGVGFAQGLLFTPGVACIAHHFRRRRNIAYGIFGAGASTGGCIFPILLQYLFPRVGFAWTVRIVAFIATFCISIGLICCRTTLPPRKGARVVDFRVFQNLPYTFLVIGASALALGVYAPLTYSVTYAVDQGMPQNLAFYTLSVMNACSTIGRTVPSLIAPNFGTLNLLIMACMASALMLFVWVSAETTAGIFIFDAIFGIFSGAYVSYIPAAVSSLTEDPKETGVRLGMLFFISAFFWLASAPLQGALIHINGSYWPASVFGGCIVAVGVGCLIISRQFAVNAAGTWKV
ncbi:major facilitator superfamily domain-containing protein [Mycena floridula]|nr:major facilitator superfamily domain-containing protein [Mycena floridula]